MACAKSTGTVASRGDEQLLVFEKEEVDIAVEALPEQHQDSKSDVKELDQIFVFPEDKRPDVVHDFFDVDLPVIDMSPVLELERLRKKLAESDAQEMTNVLLDEIKVLDAAAARVVQDIRASCEEYGFFQIINHGFPMNTVEDLKQSCRDLLEFPSEVKSKFAINPFVNVPKPPTTGYMPMKSSNVVTQADKSHIWNESFVMESPELVHPGTMEKIAWSLWPDPDEDESCRKRHKWTTSAEDYGKQASSLAFILLELMGSSFGLSERAVQAFLSQTPETQALATIRINHYPVCASPELTWGLRGHTDPDVLTLLHQDAVGGLQINFKGGTWHGVRPVPGALVVNVGDYLQAMTNGRFMSAKHRVVANSKARRMSVAYFVYCAREHVLCPRPEFVDAKHPLKYRPFTRTEYFQTLTRHGVSGDSHLLDRFFSAENSPESESGLPAT